MLLDKGHAGYSGSSFYFLNRSWGYQTVLPSDPAETRNEIVREILDAGGDEIDSRRAEILVDESWTQLEELLRWGARLRTAGGGSVRVRGCFGRREHAVCIDEHRRAFRKLARSITAMNRWTALGLLLEAGRVVGVRGVNRKGESEVVFARAVILATGGAAGLYRHFLGDPGNWGLGYALASQAGAKLRGLEFIQFMLARPGKKYPEFFSCNELASGWAVPEPPLAEAIRRSLPPGGDVDRIYRDRSGHFPFSTRDASYPFDAAVAESPRPRMRLTHGRNAILDVFHAAHAFNGGIETDEWGRTTVEGLYAVGEAAGGIHGADRLGGTMIPACLVFGRRAGESAARWTEIRRASGATARRVRPQRDIVSLSGRREVERRRLAVIRDVMSRAVGVVRTQEGLEQGIHSLNSILDEISCERDRIDFSESGSISELAAKAGTLIAQAALDRAESKGPHYRADSAH